MNTMHAVVHQARSHFVYHLGTELGLHMRIFQAPAQRRDARHFVLLRMPKCPVHMLQLGGCSHKGRPVSYVHTLYLEVNVQLCNDDCLSLVFQL